MATIALAELESRYVPGSRNQPWTWDDEERHLHALPCACCGQPGHYQQALEAHVAKVGIEGGVCLGADGRIWDGHHRIVAARRLGIAQVPVEAP